jgi:hypothetical protein
MWFISLDITPALYVSYVTGKATAARMDLFLYTTLEQSRMDTVMVCQMYDGRQWTKFLHFLGFTPFSQVGVWCSEAL